MLDAQTLMAELHGTPDGGHRLRAVPELTGEELRREIDHIEQTEAHGTAGTRPQRGAVELPASLAGTPWAIVTSGTTPVARGRIDAVGLPKPTALVTGEQVDEGKPSPLPYLKAAAALGVEPSPCAVVEDAPSGLSGLAAGATTVASRPRTLGPVDPCGRRGREHSESLGCTTTAAVSGCGCSHCPTQRVGLWAGPAATIATERNSRNRQP